MSQYALVMVDEQRICLFNDLILFQSGTDILTSRSKAVLNGLTHVYANNVKNPIIIEGHTDDIPVTPKEGSKIQNNWDLAYFRASAVANYLMKTGVDPKRVSILSFADQRPLARKKTYLARKEPSN